VSTTLLLLGALAIARFVFKTLYVLVQTFVLPGTSVSIPCQLSVGFVQPLHVA